MFACMLSNINYQIYKVWCSLPYVYISHTLSIQYSHHTLPFSTARMVSYRSACLFPGTDVSIVSFVRTFFTFVCFDRRFHRSDFLFEFYLFLAILHVVNAVI